MKKNKRQEDNISNKKRTNKKNNRGQDEQKRKTNARPPPPPKERCKIIKFILRCCGLVWPREPRSGRFSLVFPGFPRFLALGVSVSVLINSSKIRSFCGTELFWTLLRENIVLSAEWEVWFRHFFGTFLNRVLSAEPRLEKGDFGEICFFLRNAKSCEGARTGPGLFAEGLSKMFRKWPPNRPFCGEKRFMSCEGARNFAWLRGSPLLRYPVLGLPRSSSFGLPRSSSFASFCGRKRFSKNCGAPSQLMKRSKSGPPRLPTRYIYIYI